MSDNKVNAGEMVATFKIRIWRIYSKKNYKIL